MVIKEKVKNDIPSILIWGIMSFLIPIRFFYTDENGFKKAIAFIWDSSPAIKKFIGFVITVTALIFSKVCYYTVENMIDKKN
jgi:hypothetical protein